MKYSISGLALVCALLATTAVSAQTMNIADLYSTGVDDSDTPLALGTTESHWQTQYNATGWVDAIQERTNFCNSCGSIWVNHPIGDDTVARPIAHPSYVQQSVPNQKFSWRTTFNLPGDADLNTVTIAYNVGFDDVSRNATDTGNLSGCNHTVWVNGVAHEISSTGDNIRTTCSATIPAGDFVHGQNVLEFRIQNLATYYGFRWEKTSATYAVAARQPFDLFNTGVDANGAPLAEGSTDSHWEVAFNSLAWVSAVQGKTNFCNSCGSIWVNHPIGNDAIARPIAHPNYVQTTAANNKFSWRQSFNLPANADPNTVVVKYRIGFDDVSRNGTDTANLSGCNHTVWVNGTPHAVTSTGDNIRTTCTGEIPAKAVFANGANTIEFRIQNLATYYGFRFEVEEASVEFAPVAAVAISWPADQDATNDTTPTFSGTATVGSTVEVVISDLSNNVLQTLNPTVDANGLWTIDAAALTDGVYSVTATATLGNDVASQGPVAFEIDTIAPSLEITSPNDGTTLYGTPVGVLGSTDSSADTVELTVTDPNGNVLTLTAAVGAFSTSFAPTTAGTYTVELTATDALGNTDSTTSTFTWARGAITISAPADGEMTDANPTVRGTAIALAELRVWLDGTDLGLAFVAANAEWSYALTNLAPGAHTVEARNGEVMSQTVTFTVQMPIEPAPVEIASPAEGDTFEEGAITVSGTGEPGTTVVVTVGELMQTVTVDNNGDWAATFADVPAGDYTVTAMGAEGMTATVTITVDALSNNNGTNNGTNNSTNNATNNSTNNATNNSTNNGTNNGTNNETNGGNNAVTSGGTDDGCGCASADGNGTSALLLLFGLVGLRLRRRR